MGLAVDLCTVRPSQGIATAASSFVVLCSLVIYRAANSVNVKLVFFVLRKRKSVQFLGDIVGRFSLSAAFSQNKSQD